MKYTWRSTWFYFRTVHCTHQSVHFLFIPFLSSTVYMNFSYLFRFRLSVHWFLHHWHRLQKFKDLSIPEIHSLFVSKRSSVARSPKTRRKINNNSIKNIREMSSHAHFVDENRRTTFDELKTRVRNPYGIVCSDKRETPTTP